MATYKSKHTGERVDNAVTKIPESLPTEDSFIVVKSDGSASEYIPQSQVLSDKLDKQTAQTTSDQIYGKLADGSQTMFDLTMGAEPTTIPRRDTAGRIQVADGVSGNDAVNFKQFSIVDQNLNSILYPVQKDTQYSTALLTAKNIGKYYTFTTSVLTTSDYWVDPDNITVNAGTVVKILPIEDSHGAGIKPFFKIVGIDNRELYLTNGQGKCSIVKRAYGSDTTPNAIGYYSNVFSVDTDSQFGGQATSKYSTLFGVNVRADSNAEGSIVGGRYCIIDSPYTFAYGRSITTQASQETITKVVLGYNNRFNTKAILEIGNGTDSIKSNAFEVLKDGRAKVQSAPKDNTDVVRKLELDRKFDKAGGTVTGNMVVGGNFTVQGRTTTVDSENLRVADKLIEVGKGNTAPLTSPAGLITPKYDGTNNGGIVYDHTGTAYVGDISLDSNGNVDVNNSDLQPIATRNATITNNNLVKWDSTKNTLADSGKAIDDLSTATNLENGAGTGSLVQTNVVSSSGEYYTNRANGSAAIAFGKNCWSGGNTSFTIGQQNKTGNYSGGDSDSGKGGFTHGYNNINEGHYTEVGGSGNIVHGAGADTIVNGRNNHIIYSSHSAVFGDSNKVDGTYNPNNSANDNIVGGKNNNVSSSGNIVGGVGNTANGNNNSFIIGSHNSINTNSSGDRIVGGHYNKPVANALMEIGNGTSPKDRKNAFEVLIDGRAKVQTAPVDTDDVVRKLELDTKFDKTGGTISGNLTVQKKLKCESAPTENNDVLRYQDTAVEVETSLMGA